MSTEKGKKEKGVRFWKVKLDHPKIKHSLVIGKKQRIATKATPIFNSDDVRCDRCNEELKKEGWLLEYKDEVKDEWGSWGVVCDICKNKYLAKFKYLKLFSKIEEVVDDGKDKLPE